MSQTDARSDLINVFLDAVEELRPRCFVMENVRTSTTNVDSARFSLLLCSVQRSSDIHALQKS